MNKRHKRILIVVFSVLAIAILAMGTRALRLTAKSPYRFLKGRSLVGVFTRKGYGGFEEYNSIYSFPADFNSICTEAAVELGSIGANKTGWINDQGVPVKSFFSDADDRAKANQKYMIQIIDGIVLPKDSSSSYADYAWEAAPGCVTVSLYWSDQNRDIWQMIKDIAIFWK